MSMRDRIDPDSRVPLEELLKVFPGGFNAISNIVERRSTLESVLQTMVADLPPNENVVTENREISWLEDTPPVGVRVYRPKATSGTLPGIFFIHGGGMIMGSVEGENLKAPSFAKQSRQWWFQ